MNRSPPAFKQADLAKALGLSPARITALKRKGMPVDDVAAARRWREANVRPQMSPVTQWYHPCEPDYDSPAGDYDEGRDSDMADAFENIAILAHRHPERTIDHALLHLLPTLTDAQYARVRSSGYVTQRVWDAIGKAFDEVFGR